MLYQEYRQKNKECIAFLEKLWKRRFFILAGFLLLLAIIGVLLGITGIVVGGQFPASVTYGDPLNFKASAIFRDATLEYRPVGGNWSTQEPTLVGEYEVRGVSRDVVGGRRCGDPAKFTIEPRPAEVTIVGESLAYGDTPTASAQLVEGDSLTGADFSYRWLTNGLRCVVTANNAAASNEEGANVTNCYAFTYTQKTLAVTPRAITLRTAGAEKVYDGTPLTAEGYDLVSGSLAYSDRIQMDFSAQQTEAGSAENIPDLIICSEDGQDVTEFYDIQWEAGSLTVTPRSLSLSSLNVERVYGDASLDAPGIWGGTLVTGHAFVLKEDISAFEPGSYPCETLFSIVDEAGKDVTGNYALNFGGAQLIVLPRPITVWTASRTWIYDGLPHNTAEEGGYGLSSESPYPLLTGHVLSPDPKSEQLTDITDTETEVVTVENPLRLRILTEDGKDVTGNYELTYSEGELRIKTEIIITVYHGSRVYDGTPFTVGQGSYSIVKPPDADVQLIPKGLPSILEVGEMSFEQFAELAGNGQSGVSVTDVSTGEDTFLENRVRFAAAEEELPVLKVVPRPITVWTASRTWIHDGLPHGTAYEGGYGLSASSPYDMPQGHYLSPDPESEQLTEITDTETEVVTVENPLRLCIMTEEGEDRTHNFDVTYESGELRIKSEVIITFYNAVYLYDGTERSVGEDDYSVIKPPDAAVNVYHNRIPSIYDVGSLTIDDIKQADENDGPIVTVYPVGADAYPENRVRFRAAAEGAPVIEICRRPVTVTTASVSIYPTGRTFYGSSLENPWWISFGTSLLSGHRLEVEVTGVLTMDEEQAENTVGEYRVLDRSGRDVTRYYDITFDLGTLSWIGSE